jgi:hypothetical protein
MIIPFRRSSATHTNDIAPPASKGKNIAKPPNCCLYIHDVIANTNASVLDASRITLCRQSKKWVTMLPACS